MSNNEEPMRHSSGVVGDKEPLINNTTYDVIHGIVQYGLPGLGTFYFTISQIWNLAYGEEVVGTLAAIAILLGVFLGISKRSWNKSGTKYDGSLILSSVTEDADTYRLQLDQSIEDLYDKGEIRFKVVTSGPDSQ